MLADRVRMGSNSKNKDDDSGSPGNPKLIAGDMNAGFFGVVPASELITGDALSSMVGLYNERYSQFSSEGWLKFAYQGKIQFVAKKPIRHAISWGDIDDANCVYGDRTIDIDGLTYKVRLMRGANIDPTGDYQGSINHNSEWNKLMLPIHIEAKDKSWAYPNNVEADVPYWGIDFTDADLHTRGDYGNGSFSWCQETVLSGSPYFGRGGGGVSSSGLVLPVNAGNNSHGYRPVLELV